MRITHLTPDEAIASLRSYPIGLASIEAQRRLAEYGPNRVEEAKGESLALRFLREFVHFFALIVAIAYTPWGNVVFGTAPIGAEAWLFMLPFAAAMLALEEGRKAFMRRRAVAREGGS